MLVRILGQTTTQAYIAAKEVVEKCGCTVFHDSMEYLPDMEIDLNIAPLLTEKIPSDVIREPRFGTLIFHPSPLPYGRGAASIKWAYKRNEAVTAATWFWADEGLDTGNICEQEIVKIDHTIKPRQFYERDIIPALCRTLERCLSSLKIGLKREVKQQGKYATFDRKEGL